MAGGSLGDVAGAALFAFGIALCTARLAAGEALPPMGLAALVAGACVRAVALVATQRLAARHGEALAASWRDRVMPRLLGGRVARPLASGEAASLAVDHIAAIEAYGTRFMPARVGATYGPLFVLALVFVASWPSALILLATFVPFIFGMILAGKAARRASERQLSALGMLSALFVDRVRHLPLIRHFGAEDRIARQVAGATADVALRTLAVLRVAFLSGAILEFFAALAIALVAVYCGFSLLGLLPFTPPEHLTLERAFFVLAMAPEFYLPMRRLSAAYHEKQLGDAAMAALEAIEVEALPAPAGAVSFAGLSLRAVEVAWPGTRIGPVSLELGRSGMVALTGPTGSGKSSVLSVIAGLADPAAGAIAGEGGSARPDPAQVAVAAQQPLLLPGTLAENIALARPEATREEIAGAAERVGLGSLLAKRAEGLDLPIDHRGSGLSGGERRRIGLARALLSNRPLLLLDEPTADLDADSAAGITRLIGELAAEKALVVATHDPDLAALAQAEIAL